MTFAICDDEPAVRSELQGRIDAYMSGTGQQWTTEFFENGADLLKRPDWDVVFLDIQMPGLNGMETADALRRAGAKCRIVFITVLEDYVFDAFEVEASDYILKPVDAERFRRLMDRITAPSRPAGKNLVVRTGDGTRVVPYEDIVFCEVHGRKMDIHMGNGTVITYNDRLQRLEQELGADFFRCHRSYLVNLAYVRTCTASDVVTSTGDHVPLSRLRDRPLKEALMRHMSSGD